MPEPTEPHGAWPAGTYRADWQPGALDECVTCREPIGFFAHPGSDRPGGWAHLTGHSAGDHSQCRPGWCLAARGGEPS